MSNDIGYFKCCQMYFAIYHIKVCIYMFRNFNVRWD